MKNHILQSESESERGEEIEYFEELVVPSPEKKKVRTKRGNIPKM